jgi:hypothetical protein
LPRKKRQAALLPVTTERRKLIIHSLRNEDAMSIIRAFRDFAEGLARGVSLFFTERNDYDECLTIPEAALTKCLHSRRDRQTKT